MVRAGHNPGAHHTNPYRHLEPRMTATTAPATPAEALAAFEAQPALQAGTEGFWEVWGAQPRHARVGDIIISKGEGGVVHTDYVTGTFTAKSLGRQGLLDANGEVFTMGHLSRIVLVRWGTHGTLAD